MNILEDAVRGASSQFGREFGRAGANAILKGANSYTVKSQSDYTGRIKPSDTEIVKAIKEINKIKFVTTDKANVSRLIELTDLVIPFLEFKGNNTLNEIRDIKVLSNTYNSKYEHGSSLISDDYTDKSFDHLKSKREELLILMNELNKKSIEFINENLALATEKRKSKKTTTILSFPIIGALGVHKFYMGKIGLGILYFILSPIGFILSFFEFFRFLFMSQEKFDLEYNPEFAYYSQFKLEKNE